MHCKRKKINWSSKVILLPAMFIAAWFMLTCSGGKRLATLREMSKIYNPSRSYLHPRVAFYHVDSTLTYLTVKLFPVEFMYNQAREDLLEMAQIKINYQVKNISLENAPVSDTASYHYTFEKKKTKDRFYAQLPVPALDGNQYFLKLTITDLNRDFSYTDYHYINKTNPFNQQNFRVYMGEQNYLMSPPYHVSNHPFRLEYAHQATDSVWVDYYTDNQPVPKVTTTLTNYPNKPDSSWKWPYRKNTAYQLSTQGIYHIRIDTSQKEGLTLLYFDKNFPAIKQPEDMLPPLQYLTNNFEYQNISNKKNLKLAIDDYWLSKTEDIDRARELIRIYYNRAYFANYYFTSHTPGWKTDRGMVYIIFGPPEALFKNKDIEEWLYFPDNQSKPIKFAFKHQLTPFGNNNYILMRAESETAALQKTLNEWQKGDIFKIENP